MFEGTLASRLDGPTGPQGAPRVPLGPLGPQGALGAPKGLRLSTIVSLDSVRAVLLMLVLKPAVGG